MKVIIGNVHNNTTPTFQPSHQTVVELKPKKYGVDVDGYIGDVDIFGYLHDATGSGIVDMSDIWYFSRDEQLKEMFMNNPNITGVVKLGMKRFTQHAMDDCFKNTNITGFEFTELEEISPENGYSPFTYSDLHDCPMLETIKFDKLQTISTSICFQQKFSQLPRLTTFEAPLLQSVTGQSSFSSAFSGSGALTTVDLSSLETIGLSSFASAFSYTGLTSMSFTALTTVGQHSLRNAFYGCSYLTDLYFPAVTTTTFTNYSSDRSFMDMLKECDGTTVHFPASVQSTVENLADFSTGFGGTNITVLYDL